MARFLPLGEQTPAESPMKLVIDRPHVEAMVEAFPALARSSSS